MSADNGIYVLASDGEDGAEYRVIHAQAIDNIYGRYNEESLTWTPDVDMIVRYFGDAKVFYDLMEAYDYAEQLDDQYEYTEDGVCLITDFSEYMFSDFEEEYDRRHNND